MVSPEGKQSVAYGLRSNQSFPLSINAIFICSFHELIDLFSEGYVSVNETELGLP